MLSKKDTHTGLYDSRPSWLGMEIWQFLTIFTVVFSILSAGLWFQSIRPSSIRESFKQIDNSKSIIVNSLDYSIANITENIKIIKETDQISECNPDRSEVEINTTSTDQQSEILETKRNDIKQTMADVSDVKATEGYSILQEVFINADKNIESIMKYRSQEIEYQRNITALKDSFSTLCTSQADTFISNLNKYTIESNQFFDKYKSLEEFKDLNHQFIADLNISLEQYSAQDSLLSKVPDSLIEGISNFDTKLFDTTLYTYKEYSGNSTYERYKASLTKLEIWQTTYANEYKELNLHSEIILFT